MSVFKFIISKNNIARDSDSNITYDDTNGGDDVVVTLTVDGTEIHAATLVDAGCVLQYTGTLAEGYHTVKIQPEAGKPTDIRIDRVIIDNHTVVGTQYKMDTRIFGKDKDFLKYLCCKPFRSPKSSDHVWWGDVYKSDYTVKSKSTHYRPHVVTDLGEWWEWSFSVSANGHIHWTVDDSDSILYDSTENHVYYAGKSILYDGSTTFPICNSAEVDSLSNSEDSTFDSSSPSWEDLGVYDSNIRYAFGDSTTGLESYEHTSLYTSQEWYDAVWFYYFYWPANDIDPIVIT